MAMSPPFPNATSQSAPRCIPLRQAQLGEGFPVARVLPTKEQRMVGAWCFLDHLGPVSLAPGQGMHVGAHPHTCLQTFTWMIEGDIVHRDSLGTEQHVSPGQVSLMTAGHGIVHTEDSLPGATRLHAAQLWIALPPELADTAPRFAHYTQLPQWQSGEQHRVAITLLAGRYQQQQAPTAVHSPLIGLDLQTNDADTIHLTLEPSFEYGILPLQGETPTVNGLQATHEQFVFLPCGGRRLTLNMPAGSRCLLVGGEPFAQPVHMWWNFVGHTRAAVEQAQADWESGQARFGPVPGTSTRMAAPAIPWLKPPSNA